MISTIHTVTLHPGPASGALGLPGRSTRLVSVNFGRVLLIAIGIAIIALGVRLIRRGIKKKFTDDLACGVGRNVVRLGQVGYIVKGIVGGLFGCGHHLRGLAHG